MWIDENHFLNLANLLLKDAVSVLLIFITESSPELGLPDQRSGNLPKGRAQTESGMWREIERVVIKNHMNFRSLMAELFTALGQLANFFVTAIVMKPLAHRPSG